VTETAFKSCANIILFSQRLQSGSFCWTVKPQTALALLNAAPQNTTKIQNYLTTSKIIFFLHHFNANYARVSIWTPN